MLSFQREPSVDSGAVEKGVCQVCGAVKVQGRGSFLKARNELWGVARVPVDVEVHCHEAQEVQFGVGIFTWDRFGSNVKGSRVNLGEAKLGGLGAEVSSGVYTSRCLMSSVFGEISGRAV